MKKLFLKNIKIINFWFPFLGSGIKIKEINEQQNKFLISLRLTTRNKNLFGTQFGGSLYSMTDPFFVFILVLNLGDEYIVWDKSAQVDFIKPGKSKVFSTIEIPMSRIAEIKNEIDAIGKSTYFFETAIVDNDQKIIDKGQKEVNYIKKKLNFKV